MARVFVNDSTLMDIADAIREKNGTEDTYKPSQMADAVRAIESGGEEMYMTQFGVYYKPNMILNCERIVGNGVWSYAEELLSLELSNWNPTSTTDLKITGGNLTDVCSNCAKLKTLILPKLQYAPHYFARYSTALERVQFGSIGYPVTSIGNYCFHYDTQENLEITVYVDAVTLEEIGVKSTAPWGATNATIIYRNSTTGEVITA